MLKIGEFSQLGQVSVRTLRLYDELGLLKPAQIDRFTDYRYYSIEQFVYLPAHDPESQARLEQRSVVPAPQPATWISSTKISERQDAAPA